MTGDRAWSSFSATIGPLIDPAVAPPTTGPPTTYTQTVNPSVAFDANHQLYVLVQQSNAGNTSGALILTKFNFTGGSPSRVDFVDPISGSSRPYNIVRQYIQDPVFNPTLAVDDNQASFTDPTTHAVQQGPAGCERQSLCGQRVGRLEHERDDSPGIHAD